MFSIKKWHMWRIISKKVNVDRDFWHVDWYHLHGWAIELLHRYIREERWQNIKSVLHCTWMFSWYRKPCHFVSIDVLFSTIPRVWYIPKNLQKVLLCFFVMVALWLVIHWSWDKMDAISQTTLSKAFSWMKMLEFLLTFHSSLFQRVPLTISQHLFR